MPWWPPEDNMAFLFCEVNRYPIMTTIGSTDIEFLLSGGTNNSDPKKSTGGGPSSFPILGSLNNLFPDITSEEASAGKVDYRCFYVKNSGSSVTLYETEIRVSAQNLGGSYVELGIANSTDIQRIDVTGSSITGTAVLKLGSSPISVNWGSSPFGFEASLRNALSYAGFAAEVSHSISGNTASFTVTFSGINDNRSWPTLQVQENNLTGTDTPTITIRKISDGRPINSSAPSIVTDQSPPSGVNFQSGSILVGRIGPGDFAPVWARRTTPANTQFSLNDGFTVKVSGKPFLQQANSSSSSSGISISYITQPAQTFYQQVFSNTEVHISAQVVIVGSPTNSPLVTWEFSDDDGATWISTLSDPTMSADLSSVTPGTINQTLVLSGVVDSSWYGRKFRVTNSEGSVSVTSEVFTLYLGFSWITQPSNSAWIGPIGDKYSEFDYAYRYPATQAFTGGAFQYSDDGINWQDFNPSLLTLYSSMSLSGLTERGGSFRVDTFVPGRKYRVKASISNVNIYSNSALSICPVLECSQFWPVGWSEPTYSADCGLVPEPGFNKYMDCNICECAKVAISSSSS
jgi:hypothetical protein